MQNRSVLKSLILAVLLMTCSLAGAQINPSDPWNTLYETPITKVVAQIREKLLPFSAAAGFPDTRPAGLEKASYEELYQEAAGRSKECSLMFNDTIKIFAFDMRWTLGARYFQKRLEIASQLYPEKAGNEKVFEFLCRDFASAADLGFEELRYWGIPEGLILDNIWFKNIQTGFIPVKEKMLKAVVPDQVVPALARETWKKAASALVAAGNEAGIASTKVGAAGGLASFPAWRLKYAVKYFKAASKAAVVANWHSRSSDPEFWMKACDDLRQEISRINAEMEEFLRIMQ